MPSLANMRGRLPSVYQPEAGDQTLLARVLAATGLLLDEAQDNATQVMQAHWVDYADCALFSPFVSRGRELDNLPPLTPQKAEDRAVIDSFPFVEDLARLGALLPVLHRREPAYVREGVEAYRERLHRTVEIYKNGLGTLDAIRRMVEVQLPVDMSRPTDQRDHPFWIEEFAPTAPVLAAATTIGAPDAILGPLMAWDLVNEGIKPVAPTVIIQAEAEAIRPMVERIDLGVGLAYTGALAAGEALRLRPVFTSWMAGNHGVASARSDVDPTAPGPWTVDTAAPVTSISALHQTPDGVLWAATGGELWRYDGVTWALALDGLDTVHCLADDGTQLLAGTASGLLRIDLYPVGDDPFQATPVPALSANAVNAIAAGGGSDSWLGTEAGAGQLAGDVFTLSPLQGTAVFAIYIDSDQAIFFGTALGLFLHQIQGDRWHYYSGIERTEQAGDWLPFVAGTLPTDSQVALPAVHALWRSSDASLWLGTENGLARYRARPVLGLTYETILEAFPDITNGRVTTIQEDQRGLVWFGTDRGLFRYDGRQLWQFRADAGWTQLGNADQVYLPTGAIRSRGAWHFDRAAGIWRQFDSSQFVFDPVDPALVRSTAEEAVTAIHWTDGVAGDRGTWDEENFQPSSAVDVAELQLRVKPVPERIVAGGIPAVPRLLPGTTTWRYLSREPDDGAGLPIAPAWTAEARLLPPPDLDEAIPGRFEEIVPPPDSRYDEAVFAYPPVARLWFGWQAESPLSVLVRVKRRTGDEQIDPIILDRVRQGVEQVRPAGIRVVVALEEEFVPQ